MLFEDDVILAMISVDLVRLTNRSGQFIFVVCGGCFQAVFITLTMAAFDTQCLQKRQKMNVDGIDQIWKNITREIWRTVSRCMPGHLFTSMNIRVQYISILQFVILLLLQKFVHT